MLDAILKSVLTKGMAMIKRSDDGRLLTIELQADEVVCYIGGDIRIAAVELCDPDSFDQLERLIKSFLKGDPDPLIGQTRAAVAEWLERHQSEVWHQGSDPLYRRALESEMVERKTIEEEI